MALEYLCLRMPMVYVGGWVYNIQMLTDAYGGYVWVGRKYLNDYGCLHGVVVGWVCENLLLT